MRFLGYIESGQGSSLSHSLKKKESLLSDTEKSRLSFFEFTTKFSLSHCAIFSRCDKDFVIVNSLGFDCETILSSLSTADFWNGSIKKNDWTFFSRTNNSIVNILQFFSKPLKDKINFVGTFFSRDLILLVAYEKLLFPSKEFKKISEQFNMIDYSLSNEILKENNSLSPKMTLLFNYKNAMIDFILKYQPPIRNNAIAAAKINNALKMELEYKLYKLSSKYIDFTKRDLYEIECNVYSKNNISVNSLSNFLNLNLKSIFNTSVEYISYDD